MKIQVTDIESFKQKALQWAAAYDTCCYLDSHSFKDPYSKYDLLIAVGAKAALKVNNGSAYEQLEAFRQMHTGWLLGFFGYDLKNETENLSSANTDGLEFPDLYFFVPEILITIKGEELNIEGADEHILQTIQRLPLVVEKQQMPVNFTSRFNKQEYVATVEQIKRNITRGDIYVTNFCQEFYSEKAFIDPLFTYRKLKDISPTPFSAFFKWEGNYIICASPERFLAKRGNKLLSQPIKGTARRDSDEAKDEILIEQLRNHPKELQENVMIVDLVRNDLTRCAIEGTVHAEELYAIQSFAQVHQMVSTVVCTKRNDISDVAAIKNTFPMGSMTGAPKVSAMQLMEKYERSKRGVYSGALGYFSPDGDFDFNVIIRSLLYNSEKNYLSFHVGSAITYHADAEKEYEECLLKAKALLQALS
ncbi:anthranilate synthase component I family protein [Mucilaginibacter sp. 44-25]|uniref:anthranilate synthase component I family protein n=1 Tax=Mucilaginibacter sp. 44-25 TaxID=1895794 RepID=UPI000A531926|nr:anthranilate synthase component I family protein [Mucilaginibacter sp. 44-25]